jgi:hypothetical protein
MMKRALAASILVLGAEACAMEVTPPEGDEATTTEEGWSDSYDGDQNEISPGACGNAGVLEADPAKPRLGPVVYEGSPEGKLVIPIECVEERYIYMGDPWSEPESY